MPIKYRIESKDGLPEALADLYVADGEGFKLDLTLPEGVSVENVAALRSTLSKVKSEASSAKSELGKLKSALGDHSVDDLLDSHRRMAELGDDADIKAKIEAGAASKIQAMQAKHAQELEAAK